MGTPAATVDESKLKVRASFQANSIGKSIVQPFLLVTLVLSVLNAVLLGPELMVKQFIAFYEKPETTVYPVGCTLRNCAGVLAACVADQACLNTSICINQCTIEMPSEKIASCAYICEMTHGYENEPFLDVMQCMVGNNCMYDYPKDGVCKGTDADALKTITSLEQVFGDWWVIRGLNCGFGDYPGGYDGYPCQHERFIPHPDGSGQWINNVTYCAGTADKCVSQMIVTIANITMPRPGVVHFSYTDAPLAPQEEDWRILSWPDEGDYMFLLWCGKLPVLEYNGGIVMSRHRSEHQMPHHILQEFKDIAAKHNIDYYKDLCPSDNHHCPF